MAVKNKYSSGEAGSWFNTRYGMRTIEKDGHSAIPTIDDWLNLVTEEMDNETSVKMPEPRLNRLEKLLSIDIHRFRQRKNFSPHLNMLILAKMFALASGGRKVRDDLLNTYKTTLKERYSRDPNTGYIFA